MRPWDNLQKTVDENMISVRSCEMLWYGTEGFSPFPFSPLPMRNLVTKFTWLLGIVLTLIGIAGFFSGGMLFIFEVDRLHNVVHLLSGVLAIVSALVGTSSARMYLIAFGIIYGLVTVLGFMTGGSILGLFMANGADNYLHAGIALACLGVGFGSRE